jgi:hypothetical protein
MTEEQGNRRLFKASGKMWREMAETRAAPIEKAGTSLALSMTT